MKPPFRIVVTGSRHWTDAATIHRKLRYTVLTALADSADEVVIIQGGAEGADAIALAWAKKLGLPHETFEARWAVPPRRGDPAGPERNKRMIDAGAHIVLAFPFGDRTTSPGTWNCIDLAAVRGIPVALCAKARPTSPADVAVERQPNGGNV